MTVTTRSQCPNIDGYENQSQCLSLILLFIRVIPRRLGKSRFAQDCVVADAVAVEPVSDTNFANNREKYRENRMIVAGITAASSSNAASMRVFGDFLCKK